MVDIKEKVDEGWLYVRIILEMVGKPAEHVKDQMEKRVETLKQADKIHVTASSIAELKKIDADNTTRGMVKEAWATFAELELLVKDLTTLVYVCFDYMPSSVEIIEPSHVTLRDEQLTDLFTDLQARLLQVDVMAKQVASEAVFYKQSLHNLFQNYVELLLHNKPMSAQQIASLTGVEHKNVEEVMKLLIDKNKVELKEEKYHLLEEVAKSE